MSLRFRRSLRLMPGVRLNFSKSGTSVSLGGRGAHVTFGKNGYRSTIGLPGTGIYDTTYHKYGAKGTNGTTAPGQAGQTPQATGSQPACPGCGRHIYKTWNLCPYCGMPLNEDGEQFLVSIIKHYGGKIDDDEFASPTARDSDLTGNFTPLLSEEMSGDKNKSTSRYEANEVESGEIDKAAHTGATNMDHHSVTAETHHSTSTTDSNDENTYATRAIDEQGAPNVASSKAINNHPSMSREETFKALAREHLEESKEQLHGDSSEDPAAMKKGCGCIILVIIIIIIILIVAGT